MMHSGKDSLAATKHTEQVLLKLDRALAEPETELLYGRAGYLYSLLVLRSHTVPAKRTRLLYEALEAVFDGLERDGCKLAADLQRRYPDDPWAQSPLAFAFPTKGTSSVYFGAAHGLAGMLYAMLHLPERCLRAGTRERVVGALDFLVAIQTGEGNFPVALRHPEVSLVHWCHGAPGIIPTLCKAYEVFGEERYLVAARRAGDCVWSSGLLRKGLGVCHGIAGSALSQLTLYRTTGNHRHLYRALRTCEAMWSERCLKTIGETTDPTRRRSPRCRWSRGRSSRCCSPWAGSASCTLRPRETTCSPGTARSLAASRRLNRDRRRD